MAQKIRFHVDKVRLQDVPVAVILDVEDRQSLNSMVGFLCYFAMNDKSEYLDPDEAKTTIRELTVGQLQESTATVMGALNEVVPKK